MGDTHFRHWRRMLSVLACKNSTVYPAFWIQPPHYFLLTAKKPFYIYLQILLITNIETISNMESCIHGIRIF